MGYRSEVAALFSLGNEETFNKYVNMIKEYRNEYEKNYCIFDEIKINKNTFTIYCHGDYLKWYDDYEDVIAFEKIMHSVDKETDSGVHFIRIGEYYDDVEERCIGDIFYYLDFNRSLGWTDGSDENTEDISIDK